MNFRSYGIYVKIWLQLAVEQTTLGNNMKNIENKS